MIWLANIVLVLHALIVVFIVGGLFAIWIAHGLRLPWARNRTFRTVHVLAIGIVATLAVLNVPCPLTVLEDHLRTGTVGPQGFVQRWVSAWLYYDFPGWVFVVAYVAFLLAVILTWYRIRPRA
ncbi:MULTISPECIES: DUF2784 domain-containing protein [unclassified Paraburkholderia]|uniref:DUF2784 domain-containing protein n=1 Tax=unclassified Paraburkholderia TaxID=2615204 RepID=UPI00160F6C14|nr:MULTISPECIES: DUF2784 domain-containing protein [unclassified Paraburkholderia]MBB5444878.1 hypothetical protein [Paraburkholderia sp. WSM4177]MBB5483810.1 hypothetical protein [Paraburkholderia sp. WSM4180]